MSVYTRLCSVIIVSLFVLSCYGDQSPYDYSSDAAVYEQSPNRGNLVMLGGGPRPDSVMELIVSLSPDSTFIVVPMASSIADTIGWEHRDQFLGYGAKRVEIMMLEDEDIDSPEILEQLRSASGIWFSGGDQRQLMHYFGTDLMKEAVHQAYKNGAVIAGTSAGTAVQSAIMITGDERHGVRDPFGVIVKDNVITTPGLGLVDNIIVDQHFIRRSRLNRLINVLVDEDAEYAAGVDEATALWFKGDGMVEVVGESQVILLDASESESVVGPNNSIGASDIRLHVLPAGSTFRWQQNRVSGIVLGE